MRVRNDVVERGSVTKSQKGKKSYVERKVGECFQWEAHRQCSKGDSCSFSHDTITSGNSGEGQRRRGRSSSLASHSKAKQTDGDGHKSSKGSGNKEESSLDKSETPCRFKFCKNPSWKFWHPPVCQNYKSEKGCIFGDKCHFRHVETEGKPNKNQRKVVQRIRCDIDGVCTIGLKILFRESLFYLKKIKIGIKTRRQILQEHLASN